MASSYTIEAKKYYLNLTSKTFFTPEAKISLAEGDL